MPAELGGPARELRVSDGVELFRIELEDPLTVLGVPLTKQGGSLGAS